MHIFAMVLIIIMFTALSVGSTFSLIKDKSKALTLSVVIFICITSSVSLSFLFSPSAAEAIRNQSTASSPETIQSSTSDFLRKEWSAAVGRGETTLGYDAWLTNLNAQWSQDVTNNKTTLGYEDWVRRKYQ